MGQVKDVVEQYWAAFEAGDLDAAEAFASDDLEFMMPGAELRGVKQVRGAIEPFMTAFPDLKHEFLDWIEADDTFAAELRITATHTGTFSTPGGDVPPTGRQIVWRSCDYIKARDGKIVSWHAYFDQVAFLTQLGVMPEQTASAAT